MAGSLFSLPRQTALGTNARALPGAKLTFYRAGTTSLANVFADAELTTPRANPVIASASGRFPAIYLDNETGYAYRVTLSTDDNALVWDEDNVPAAAGGGDGGGGGDGEPGLSVAEITIYVRTDATPTTPAGGSFSFATQALTPPEGWSVGIPAGSAPVWSSRAVAAATTPTGADDVLEWSSPVKVLSDGSSVDIIFTRAEAQPATPSPSPGVPVGWYTDVASVPAGAGVLWSSIGSRPHEGFDWIWQLPIQVEGSPGQDGEDGTPGTPGVDGDGITVEISAPAVSLVSYTNGNVLSYAVAEGQLAVYNSGTDVTEFADLSATPAGCAGTINTAANVPVSGKPKGYYCVTSMSGDTATLTLAAVYNGQTYVKVFSLSKSYVGFEIVASTFPTTNLFSGRMVFRESDGKLYRYFGGQWTAAVPAVDITGQLSSGQIGSVNSSAIIGQLLASQIAANAITADKIAAGVITSAKINATQFATVGLSAITGNVGTLTSGIIQSASGSSRFDLSNARIIFNSAPGLTGGMVRVQGAGFGPSSDYLDWYGPKPAGQSTDAGIVANLTDSAAVYFLKITGESKAATQRIRGEFEPKAWGCINADTTPATINDRYNIASVDKPDSGLTRVYFAEALANANYACCTGAFDVSKDVVCMVQEQTTTYVTFRTVTRGAGSAIYPTRLNFVVLGSNVPGGSNVTAPDGGTGGGTIGWGNLPSNYYIP